MIGRQILVAARLADVFLRKHGHSKKRRSLPVDGRDDFQPWLTYPMIEFLNGLDLSEKSVLEFGAGGSTLYWARRSKEVISVELDQEWANKLASCAPPNVTIIHEPDGGKYPEIPRQFSRAFDVILIDGAERYRSSITALDMLAESGMIILDNAEWYPNCCDLLGENLIEMPFSGFAPLNAFTSTSTAFLRRSFSFQRGSRSPPIGGRMLKALDDSG